MQLSEALPLDEMVREYRFRGDEEVDMREAMQLMEDLAQMEELEQQVRRAQKPKDIDKIDPAAVERLLGPDAARDLERLREIAKKLEEAGYLERQGDRLKLTARAIRKIGEKALRHFENLKRDRFGRHAVEHRGAGGDRTDEAKRYEFGDPFLLDLKETLMNAVERKGPGTPVPPVARRLRGLPHRVADAGRDRRHARHEPVDAEQRTLPARQEGGPRAPRAPAQPVPARHAPHPGLLALRAPFTAEQLPGLSWSEWNIGTNMHHGFQIARQLLGRHKGPNKHHHGD